MRPPLRPTLFPYTTLFRSVESGPERGAEHRPARSHRGGDRLHRRRLLRRFRLADDDGRTIGTIAVGGLQTDRKSTRLNSSHVKISYAVFCLKKKIQK